MARMKNLVIDGSQTAFKADRGALNLLSNKERKKVRVHAVHFAALKWAQKYVPLLFTNYVRRHRGYRGKGGNNRRPFHEEGDAERQVLRGTTVRVTGTSKGATARVNMPFPHYVTQSAWARRVLNRTPQHEANAMGMAYEREMARLINQDERPDPKMGRQTIILRSRK